MSGDINSPKIPNINDKSEIYRNDELSITQFISLQENSLKSKELKLKDIESKLSSLLAVNNDNNNKHYEFCTL